MKWVRTITLNGEETMQEGTMPDPFWHMATQDGPKATVGTHVSRSAEVDGGWVKCVFDVSLQCPQTKACMDQAAELAFKTAVEYVNDGMSHLAPGLPPIPTSP